MVAVSFTYKPTSGGAIHREQIQAIAGGLERLKKRPQKYKKEKKEGHSQYWCDPMEFYPRFAGGTLSKTMLSQEDDYNRGYKRDKNARARREKHRPSDHTTIRRMDLH